MFAMCSKPAAHADKTIMGPGRKHPGFKLFLIAGVLASLVLAMAPAEARHEDAAGQAHRRWPRSHGDLHGFDAWAQVVEGRDAALPVAPRHRRTATHPATDRSAVPTTGATP